MIPDDSALVSTALCTQAEAAPLVQVWAEGRILVQARAGLDDEEFPRILDEQGAGRALLRLKQLGTFVVEMAPGREKAVIRALLRVAHVKFSELDRVVELANVLPKDPQFLAAWHLFEIRTSAAWMTSHAGGVTERSWIATATRLVQLRCPINAELRRLGRRSGRKQLGQSHECTRSVRDRRFNYR